MSLVSNKKMGLCLYILAFFLLLFVLSSKWDLVSGVNSLLISPFKTASHQVASHDWLQIDLCVEKSYYYCSICKRQCGKIAVLRGKAMRDHGRNILVKGGIPWKSKFWNPLCSVWVCVCVCVRVCVCVWVWVCFNT